MHLHLLHNYIQGRNLTLNHVRLQHTLDLVSFLITKIYFEFQCGKLVTEKMLLSIWIAKFSIFGGTIPINKSWPTSGLRSLCTTPASCMKLTADTKLCNSWLASASPKSFFLLILSRSSPPRRSSITKYVWNWQRRRSGKTRVYVIALLLIQVNIQIFVVKSTQYLVFTGMLLYDQFMYMFLHCTWSV